MSRSRTFPRWTAAALLAGAVAITATGCVAVPVGGGYGGYGGYGDPGVVLPAPGIVIAPPPVVFGGGYHRGHGHYRGRYYGGRGRGYGYWHR